MIYYLVAITDPEIPLTSEDLLKLGEHHHEASDSIVTSGKGTRNKVDPPKSVVLLILFWGKIS